MINFFPPGRRISGRLDQQFEGTFLKSSRGFREGGRPRDWGGVLITVLWLSTGSAAFPPAEKADFIIVENPANLVIYNRYEQQITPVEGKLFLPYQPLQMLEEDIFLSDNFTPVMKIRLNNQTYYLLKNHHQELMNAELVGYHQLFRNTTLIGDTVEVLADRALSISKQPPFQAAAQSQKYFLPEGLRLKRLFRYRNFVYVETLTDDKDFGWIYLAENTENSLWRIHRQPATEYQQIPPRIVFEVEQKIEEVNDLLQKLFTHFNKITRQEKAVPYWDLDIQEDKISCTLKTESYQKAFPESTKYLVNSLKNMLLGTPFDVFDEDHLIEIRRKQASR